MKVLGNIFASLLYFIANHVVRRYVYELDFNSGSGTQGHVAAGFQGLSYIETTTSVVPTRVLHCGGSYWQVI